MRRFPVPGLRPGRTRLDAAASHHVLRVLRVPRGGTLGVSDGATQLGVATLVGVEDGLAVLDVAALHPVPAKVPRIVLLGAPKPALVEEALTLGTEVGATRFVVVRAERSLPGRLDVARLERIVAAAVTQCGRADTPDVVVGDFAAAVADAVGVRLVGAPGAPGLGPTAGPVTVAIGPEGGWSPGESAALATAGFVAVGLGPHVLRAPTAVAVALARLG